MVTNICIVYPTDLCADDVTFESEDEVFFESDHSNSESYNMVTT